MSQQQKGTDVTDQSSSREDSSFWERKSEAVSAHLPSPVSGDGAGQETVAGAIDAEHVCGGIPGCREVQGSPAGAPGAWPMPDPTARLLCASQDWCLAFYPRRHRRLLCRAHNIGGSLTSRVKYLFPRAFILVGRKEKPGLHRKMHQLQVATHVGEKIPAE